MRADKLQIVAYGRRRRHEGGKVEVVVEGGDGTPLDKVAWLRNQLVSPRWTPLSRFQGEELGSSFVDDLAARDFDLATFRFSIYLEAANKELPKRLQRIRLRPGILHARYARDPDCGPDICSAWAYPCTRRDSSFFMSFMTLPVFANFAATQSLDFRDGLRHQGLDIRTLRFEIHKLKVEAGAAAEVAKP